MAYPYEMAKALPGMLADDGFTDKRTLAAAVAIGCGFPVHFLNGRAVMPGTGVAYGVAILDALHLSGYPPMSAVAVLRRGRIWVPVTAAGAITVGGVAKYAAAGTWDSAATNTFPNASFQSAIEPGPMGNVVLIELHDPTL
ncbi:MAG: hypothetical protein JWP29_3554 [Rhodoferax sp.]|nr:hypothetical protein [Rhodoferax sp.]